MIEIEEQERASAVVPLSAFQFLLELDHQSPMIGQLGDRIGRRQCQNALLFVLFKFSAFGHHRCQSHRCYSNYSHKTL